MRKRKNKNMLIREKVTDPLCPKCGKPMEDGFAVANRTLLRWQNQFKVITISMGKPLRVHVPWFSGPGYSGVRCDECGIVMLSYEQDMYND